MCRAIEQMSRFCCYAIIVSVAVSGSAAGQSTQKPPSSAIRSVRLDTASPPGTATVVVESTGGPLPEPDSGAPLNPPRIYLDFAGVLATTVVQPESDPIVSRIRVAEHTASPLVTRVVVNLNKAMPYRIDASARTQGRVVLIIGGSQARTPAVANPGPRPESPAPPPAPTAAAPKPPVATPPPSRGRTDPAQSQYDTRVAAVLVRIHALKPLLEAIDRRVETLSGDLAGAAKEFDDLAQMLSALKPPSARATAHALLLRTCTLGARAARLRQNASASQDANATWDAASAAAGALLMLEKANGELGGK
jgi:hypothetical protein